ncbi:unnamed protein product [Penicillium crustosum]
MKSQDIDTCTAALQTEINHFMSIPWCRPHLCEPNFQPIDKPREATPDNGHTLLGKTWFTEDTIPHLLTLYRQPSVPESLRGELRRFHTYSMPDVQPAYTVALNITYKKAIKTPETIMARSWITKTEGRKIWGTAQIESGTGEIYATAEGVFVKAIAKI